MSGHSGRGQACPQPLCQSACHWGPVSTSMQILTSNDRAPGTESTRDGCISGGGLGWGRSPLGKGVPYPAAPPGMPAPPAGCVPHRGQPAELGTRMQPHPGFSQLRDGWGRVAGSPRGGCGWGRRGAWLTRAREVASPPHSCTRCHLFQRGSCPREKRAALCRPVYPENLPSLLPKEGNGLRPGGPTPPLSCPALPPSAADLQSKLGQGVCPSEPRPPQRQNARGRLHVPTGSPSSDLPGVSRPLTPSAQGASLPLLPPQPSGLHSRRGEGDL